MDSRYANQRAILFGNPRSNPTSSQYSESRPLNRKDEKTKSPATMEELMEEGNDDLLHEIEKRVSTLKNISHSITHEIAASNTIINTLKSQFTTVQSSMKKSMGQLDTIMNEHGGRHIYYLALFLIVVFLMLWYISA